MSNPHTMYKLRDFPSGAESWQCHDCPHLFVVQYEPRHTKVVLQWGDTNVHPAESSMDSVSCEWSLQSGDLDDDVWETECGNDFVFFDGGPIHNKMQYCPYCGRKLIER